MKMRDHATRESILPFIFSGNPKFTPSPEVHITAFNQSARQISVDGEANNASLAYQFADKVKKNPDLRMFQFEMAAPRILPNDHAQFRLEGKPR